MTVRPPGATGTQQGQDQPRPQDQVKDLGAGSLAGNLTRDPELRWTPAGVAVADMRVAVQDRVLDTTTGKWTSSPTEFFTVECWRQLAENAAEHLRRGHRIVAEGRWKQRTWEDKNGDTQEQVLFTATELGPSLLFAGARVLTAERPKQ